MSDQPPANLPAVIDLPVLAPDPAAYELTMRAFRFAVEYTTGDPPGVLGVAAAKAGYAKKSASQAGSKLLLDPEVRRLIFDIQAAMLHKRMLSRNDIRVMLSNEIRDREQPLAARVNAANLLCKIEGWLIQPEEAKNTTNIYINGKLADL